jgi:hypothetical protein
MIAFALLTVGRRIEGWRRRAAEGGPSALVLASGSERAMEIRQRRRSRTIFSPQEPSCSGSAGRLPLRNACRICICRKRFALQYSRLPQFFDKQPFKAVHEGDMKALAESGEPGLLELLMATHAGMTVSEFSSIVTDWLATARDPRFKRLHTELVYQPMLELLAYLRANGFKTSSCREAAWSSCGHGARRSTGCRPSR